MIASMDEGTADGRIQAVRMTDGTTWQNPGGPEELQKY